MAPIRLSERAILNAAVELSRREGLKGLTMRALADALGVSPMATYHYVSSRDELLSLVAGEIMRSVPPPPPGGPWEERLLAYMLAMGDALAAVPGLVDVVLQSDPSR
ncbi:MAG TPA: helix-turn-helix domain-containing protein, partial [Acidimicrobiales bacterium]|nr:helix-turn-helix domain-containing protein [Acidimicrobiales bacterium]